MYGVDYIRRFVSMKAVNRVSCALLPPRTRISAFWPWGTALVRLTADVSSRGEKSLSSSAKVGVSIASWVCRREGGMISST